MWDLAKIKFKPADVENSKIVAIIDFSCLFPGIGIKMLTGNELEITVNAFQRDRDFPGYDKSKPLDESVLSIKMMIPHGDVNSWLELLNGNLQRLYEIHEDKIAEHVM